MDSIVRRKLMMRNNVSFRLMRKCSNSAYRFDVGCLDDLKNQLCHIEKVVGRKTSQEIINN
jgi:hypothetical protein